MTFTIYQWNDHADALRSAPKSVMEAIGVPKSIEIALEPGDTSMYIFTCGKMAFPVDKTTPLEAIENGCGLSLLTFVYVGNICHRSTLPKSCI